MNKILFKDGKKAFIPFITGGDPDIETTEKLIFALDKAKADIIEIGIPFSDPVAEGPVIEAASERALKAGCTVDKLFEMITRIRGEINAGLVFMTYYNPIFAYGVEKFTAKTKACGVDGLIVPDLPFEERDELLKPCVANGLYLISLIAPTSEERIDKIAKNSEGFLYCVSSLGVTGERDKIGTSVKKMISRAKAANNIPCCVGFGISNAEQAGETAKFADGVIVGSAIVKLVEQYGRDSVQHVAEFAEKINKAVK